ncbi:MAG: hypothetical protein ACP5JT_00210 [Thermoplasmata archaeon]|jgi:predicted regulator of Ras-like GTPase activity (Roadblock/LC7/MglB family)
MDTGILENLGLEALAIVRRDGMFVDGVIPNYVDKETFSIMSATIFMSTISTYTEFKLSQPEKILVYNEGLNMLLYPKNEREIVVSLFPNDKNPDEIYQKLISLIK